MPVITTENAPVLTAIGLWLSAIVQAIPKLYVIWALPLLLTLVLVMPPWQHPDEIAHFLRAAQIADGMVLGERFGPTAGRRSDPAIIAAVLPFNGVPGHPDVKVTEAMYAGARFHWTGKTEEILGGKTRDIGFPNTAIYPPFLYVPGVAAIWAGRALDLTIIQTLYLGRAANAISSALLTLAALAFARRTRCALAVLAALPMTLALYASASQDALIISFVLLAVGAIDRIIDQRRNASDLETLLITLALLFPAMARPPYAALSGLLLLTNSIKSTRVWMAGTAIVLCTGIWWAYLASSLVQSPGRNMAAQWALSVDNPTRVIVVAWSTLTTQAGTIGEQMIGVLGWLDTRLPLPFVQMTAALFVLALIGATAGPTRRPWLAVAVIVIGVLALFLMFYFATPPDAPVVVAFQGRYFLPFAAAVTLALPQLPRLGTKILALASAGFVLLMLVEPAIVLRTIVVRYYLGAG